MKVPADAPVVLQVVDDANPMEFLGLGERMERVKKALCLQLASLKIHSCGWCVSGNDPIEGLVWCRHLLAG